MINLYVAKHTQEKKMLMTNIGASKFPNGEFAFTDYNIERLLQSRIVSEITPSKFFIECEYEKENSNEVLLIPLIATAFNDYLESKMLVSNPDINVVTKYLPFSRMDRKPESKGQSMIVSVLNHILGSDSPINKVFVADLHTNWSLSDPDNQLMNLRDRIEGYSFIPSLFSILNNDYIKPDETPVIIFPDASSRNKFSSYITNMSGFENALMLHSEKFRNSKGKVASSKLQIDIETVKQLVDTSNIPKFTLVFVDDIVVFGNSIINSKNQFLEIPFLNEKFINPISYVLVSHEDKVDLDRRNELLPPDQFKILSGTELCEPQLNFKKEFIGAIKKDLQ